jgi:hypothetical protein
MPITPEAGLSLQHAAAHSQPPRDLAVGRLDDLGGFPDCLVPDSGVGVREGLFGGVEPSGDRRPPLDGDGGAPSLVEVADGEDAVLIASLGEGVLDFLQLSRARTRAGVPGVSAETSHAIVYGISGVWADRA